MLLPVQSILQVLGPLLSSGVRRCSPEQPQLLRTAQHNKEFFKYLVKYN